MTASKVDAEESIRLLEVNNNSESDSSEPLQADDLLEEEREALRNSNASRTRGVLSRPALWPKPIVYLLQFLLPSFVSSRLFPLRNARDEPAHERSTAYLDGLRGIAAFIVFLFHMTKGMFASTFYGYGYEKKKIHYFSLFLLPFPRILVAGASSVYLFFAISGMALSVKPTKQMKNREYGALLETLSSATLRRPIRLLLPGYIINAVVFLLERIGFWRLFWPLAHNKDIMSGEIVSPMEGAPEQFFPALGALSRESFDMLQPFDFEDYPFTPHNTPLWTIVIEFRASLALFLTQLMVARLQNKYRIGCYVLLMLWAILRDRWEMFLFWGGAMVLEIDTLIHNDAAPTLPSDDRGASSMDFKPEANSKTGRFRNWPRMVFILTFVVGLYLWTWPNREGQTIPGYVFLGKMIPSWIEHTETFWPGIGSVMILFAVSQLSFLSSLMVTGPVKYLGSISYALYLTHDLVLRCYGFICHWIAFQITGTETAFQRGFGFALAIVPITIGVIWIADITWRAVDQPCLKFARWVERRIIVRP